MISAALMGLVSDQQKTINRLNHMGIPGTEFVYEKKEKYGILGNTMTVKVHGKTEEEAADQKHHHDHHHAHSHVHMTMCDIHKIVDNIETSEKVKQDVKNIYKILASKIHVGNGTVKCAHGILPVPAPATANILSDLPYEHGEIDGEICTPTAAAVVKYFVDDYIEEKPEKKPDSDIGIGIGKKTFSTPSYFAAWRI